MTQKATKKTAPQTELLDIITQLKEIQKHAPSTVRYSVGAVSGNMSYMLLEVIGRLEAFSANG